MNSTIHENKFSAPPFRVYYFKKGPSYVYFQLEKKISENEDLEHENIEETPSLQVNAETTDITFWKI